MRYRYFESRNDDEFMRDGAEAQEALLVALNTKLDQQFADIMKHFAASRSSLPDNYFKFSSENNSGFKDFCRRLPDFYRENVQSRQRGIEASITEALTPSEQIFQTLDSQFDK